MGRGARRRVNFSEIPRSSHELRLVATDFAIFTKAVAAIAARHPLTGIEQQVVSRAGRLAHDFLVDTMAAAIDAGGGK